MTDQKAYYQKNKERIKARTIAYRKANHARDRARDRAYKALHKAEIYAQNKAYRDRKKLERPHIPEDCKPFGSSFYDEDDQKRVEKSLKYNHGNELNYHYRRVAKYEKKINEEPRQT